MLIVNYVINTLPNEKTENEDFDECSQLRSRSKRIGRKKKVNFQNKCVSSQQMKEGAVAASHLPSASWLSHHQA